MKAFWLSVVAAVAIAVVAAVVLESLGLDSASVFQSARNVRL